MENPLLKEDASISNALKAIQDAMGKASTLDDKVDVINTLRAELHKHSPFKSEPVDFVTWVKSANVQSNDYNPNKVAPPEMELLEVSIMNDGYTQPIVTWPKEGAVSEVIDGFHRSRVGKESAVVKDRVKGYLPTVAIRKEQQGKNDRVASTIRHNRARGKHQVDAMSEIVLELKNRNWTNKRIARELGMDEDEILRLCQITGLEHMFSDADFSMSWVADDTASSDGYEPLDDAMDKDEIERVRTANTNDPDRKFHTCDKWECQKAGFWSSTKDGMTNAECVQAFADAAKNKKLLRKGMANVAKDWVYSCEQNLLNTAMNRLAWIVQAAICEQEGVPSKFFQGGWELLTEKQQDAAYNLALTTLNNWLHANGFPKVEMSEAISQGRQVEIY